MTESHNINIYAKSGEQSADAIVDNERLTGILASQLQKDKDSGHRYAYIVAGDFNGKINPALDSSNGLLDLTIPSTSLLHYIKGETDLVDAHPHQSNKEDTQ